MVSTIRFSCQKKGQAQEKIAALKKKGEGVDPIIIAGRTIASTFWGKSWCKNLESYSDYRNRLPRGRSYVRNGAVIDLSISSGAVRAQVQGSRLYRVSVSIQPYPKEKWQILARECSSKIDSMIELLQGKLSKGVMEIITDKERGLFPSTREITFDCSCSDSAYMCKHVAAVLYGIGARLDGSPEQLFFMRQVDHLDLINSVSIVSPATKSTFKADELSSLFDIELEESSKDKVAQKLDSSKVKKASKKMPLEKDSVPEKTPEKKVSKKPRKSSSQKHSSQEPSLRENKASTSVAQKAEVVIKKGTAQKKKQPAKKTAKKSQRSTLKKKVT